MIEEIKDFISKTSKETLLNHCDNTIIMNITDFENLGVHEINGVKIIGNKYIPKGMIYASKNLLKQLNELDAN